MVDSTLEAESASTQQAVQRIFDTIPRADPRFLPLHIASIISACEQDLEGVQGALLPYLFDTDPLTQTAVDLIAALPEIRIAKRRIQDTRLHYYGMDFVINGLDEKETYEVFEINLGLLGVKDSRGNIAGALNLHPYKFIQDPQEERGEFSTDLLASEEIFRSFLAEKRQVPADEAALFLKEYNDFFAEETEDAEGQPIQNFKQKSGIQECLNVLPVNAKFEIWRLVRQASPAEQEKVYRFIQSYGPPACLIFSAFEGEKDLALAVVDLGLESLGKEQAGMAAGIISLAAEFELFSWQIRNLSPSGEKALQEETQALAVDLRSQVRDMVREMAQASSSAHGLSSKGLAYFYSSFSGLHDAYYLLSQLNQGGPVNKREIPLGLIEAATRVRQELPQSRQSFRAVVLYWTMQGTANQQGMSEEQKEKLVYQLYARNPDLFNEASETTADTPTERTRNINALKGARQRNLLPDKDWVVYDYGCDTGERVLQPTVDGIRQMGGGIANLVGFDIRDIERVIPGMEFCRTNLRNIPELYLGKADLGLENWSPTFDPGLLSSYEGILARIALSLRPPEEPLDLNSVIRELKADDILSWDEEQKKRRLGGVFIRDVAVPWGPFSHEPAIEAFREEHPFSVPGEKTPHKAYAKTFVGEFEGQPDSFIDDLFRWRERLRELGLVILNLPDDPVEMNRLYEQVKKGPQEEDDYSNPWDNPFWFTRSGFLRVTAIMGLVGDPRQTTDPVFMQFLAH